MERLTQILRRRDQIGEPLPDFLPALHEQGVRLRKAQVCLVVGRPGAGKSLFGLFAALRMKVPTLFVSADTDVKTLMWRAAAVQMNTPVDQVRQMIGTSAQSMVEDAFTEIDQVITIMADSNPRLSDIAEEVHATEEVWGHYPSLIIVDSLYNVAMEDGGETWQGAKDAMKAFHGLARKTGAAVMVMHHASLNRSKDDEPAGMSAVLGQVSDVPEMVLSVMMDDEDNSYRVAVVKNRHGRANTKGHRQITVAVDPETMTIYNTEAERRLALHRREWE